MNKKIFLKCKIRFFLIWLIFVGLAFGNAFAVPMTREQASMAVSTWLSRGASLTSELSGGVLDVIDIKSPDKATIGYLVRLTKGGFVVTSSDDRVMPILCFSAENVDNFVQDSSNPLYEFLCVNVSEQMGVTKSEEPIPMSSPDGTYTQNKWSSLLSPPMPMSNGKSAISDVRVSPLLSTKWSQDNIGGKPCYNYYTPNNYVCGCVATAYAQVMKFYGYPTNSVPQVSNTCYVDEVSATYSTIGGVYDWNNMPKVPSSSMTDTQRQAIGKLTYDLGVCLGMMWSSDGSGAILSHGVAPLMNTYGYESIKYYNNESISNTLFKKATIPSLEVGSPILIGIDGAMGGHAVVVDGYGYSDSDLYFHINMGWGGYQDMWYIVPDIQDFNVCHAMVYNIFPEESGEAISGRVLDNEGLPIADAVVTATSGGNVYTTTSDRKGCYGLIVSPGKTYDIVSSKAGETSEMKVIEVLSSINSFRVGNEEGIELKFTGVESAVRPEIFPSDITQFSGESLIISMSTSTQGAFIFYTLDGSDPDETSNLYTSPFAISNTTTVKAIAVKEGMNPSPIFTRTYTAEKAYDYFDFPMDISGPSGRASFNNTGFGMEENEPCHSFIPNTTTSYYEFHSGWFRWKAHDSGKITFIASCDGEETVGSTTTYYTYPSFVSVYTGGSVSTLTRVSPGTYDGSTYSSSVTINVVKGLVYYIATTISSESGGGEMVLRWSSNLKPLPMPPVFDNVSVGNVTDNSAELSMVVSSYGVGSTNVTLNLYYSETESLDNVICVTNNVECSVPISYVLRDLSLNTKYYVRVVATNDDGLEARSRVLSFVTTGSALIAPIIGVQETSGGSVLGFENTSTGENFVIAISNPQVGVTYVPCVSEAIDGVYSELNEYAVTATESNKTMFIKIPSTSATLFVKIKAHTN